MRKFYEEDFAIFDKLVEDLTYKTCLFDKKEKIVKPLSITKVISIRLSDEFYPLIALMSELYPNTTFNHTCHDLIVLALKTVISDVPVFAPCKKSDFDNE